MPDPPNSAGRKTQATQEIDSNAPPIPTRKRYKGQAHSSDSSRQKSKEDNELLQIPPENLDFNSVQRIQSLASKYKQLFEQVDQEKGTLINQRHDLQLRYDEIQGKFETEKKRLQQRAQDSEVEVSNLKKQLVESKAEASMYQSALGKATNVRWGDEDSNNLVQLTKVITEIVNSLTEVTTVKGRDITIDDDAANELFQKYNCSTRISVKSWKPILAAALQRLIVETLFHELANYLNHSDPRSKPKPQHLRQPSQLSQTQTQTQPQLQSQSQPQPQPQQQQQQPPPPQPQQQQQQQQQPPSSPINSQPDAQTQAHAVFANIKKDSPKRSSSLIVPKSYPQPVVIDQNNNLEAEIYLSMTQLVGLVNHLAEARTGTDDITKITPIKIRQQIYAVLGTRGFCKNNHPFIDQLTTKILDTLSRYRQIKNEERLADLKEHTIKLIREIVHLYFRLNAQEPVPDFKDFFEAGTPVQNNVMDGAWDDDLIDNLEVEICSFPLISVKSSKDQSKRVLCKAQVVTRSKNN